LLPWAASPFLGFSGLTVAQYSKKRPASLLDFFNAGKSSSHKIAIAEMKMSKSCQNSAKKR
jgi:hypothetical protein